jgi:NADH-quinone oxidoreductase subunit J
MHELLLQVIFYVFAGLTALSAFFVITQNNPVRCVLFLVLAFFSSSVLWILLQAEFLALILVLVYVGAVMTLFLFVVMMLNIDIESMKKHFLRYLPLGLLLVAILVSLLLTVLPKHWSESLVDMPKSAHQYVALNGTDTSAVSNTEALGMLLYTDYVLAFELAAVILLVAIIAAITLAHHNSGSASKKQNIVQQIMTRRADRIKLVTMPSEKP